ncbi:sel1 repeat family protein [Solimicrobium silvestre]|uniref:sel1 repeat family protein n=1 Tax=Solimicrobium silvestre TaxID=2099400 RepID=UPI0010570C57|nr:sel1 repeat family protein [Solimicrobium silvestre]
MTSASQPVEAKTTSSDEGEIFGLNLDGKTVAQYVREYYGAADKGDPKAAFKIYQAELICDGLKSNERAQSTKGEGWLNGADMRKAQKLCDGFNGNRNELLKYIAQAAKGGVADAQALFINTPPDWVLDGPLIPDTTNPHVKEWYEQAIGYLNQAATQGNQMAMLDLARIYKNGDGVQKNLQMAATFEIAYFQIHKLPLSNPLVANITNQLTPDQVREATSAAQVYVAASDNANNNQ